MPRLNLWMIGNKPYAAGTLAEAEHMAVSEGNPNPLAKRSYKARAKAVAWLRTGAYEAVTKCEAADSLQLVSDHMRETEEAFYQMGHPAAVRPGVTWQMQGGVL